MRQPRFIGRFTPTEHEPQGELMVYPSGGYCWYVPVPLVPQIDPRTHARARARSRWLALHAEADGRSPRVPTEPCKACTSARCDALVLRSCGGRRFLSPMNGTQARAELGFLRSVDWIDQQTRAVVADMNVYRSGLAAAWPIPDRLSVVIVTIARYSMCTRRLHVHTRGSTHPTHTSAAVTAPTRTSSSSFNVVRCVLSVACCISPNLDTIVIFSILFELPPGGGVIASVASGASLCDNAHNAH